MAKKKELTNEQLLGELLTRLYAQRSDLEGQQSEIDDQVNVLNEMIPALERVGDNLGTI